jgi:anion-transporting  ArsA/GET3 family ATPase
MSGLLDRRLIFVTGKGGVGKSTVAIALGLLGVRTGRRTIVAELASQDRVQRTFAHEREHFREVELAPGLFTISIDPQHSMEEYLRIKTGPLGQALGSSKLFQSFAMATPGMRELLSIGKVWELAQLHRKTRGAASYDLVVVDAPATGHGVGLLRAPRTFAELARVGPIAHQGQTIAKTIADGDFTAVVAVATPEEMPVNETIELAGRLSQETTVQLAAVIVNRVLAELFGRGEEQVFTQLRRPALVTELKRLVRVDPTPVLDAARLAVTLRRTRAEHLERLRSGIDPAVPMLYLPYLFTRLHGVRTVRQVAKSFGEELGA